MAADIVPWSNFACGFRDKFDLNILRTDLEKQRGESMSENLFGKCYLCVPAMYWSCDHVLQ